MQAILLLAHKGVDYIDNFCNQFDDNFNIYIHYDTKLKLSDKDILLLKAKHSNIKTIISKYSGQYFGMSLIDAEIELLKTAINDNNTYFHLMSEQCYLIVPCEKFYNYFNNTSKEHLIFEYDKEGWQILDIDKGLRWAGSQWWSLSNSAVKWILNTIETTDYDTIFRDAHYKFNYGKEHRIIAADETYFTNMFKIVDNDFEFDGNKRYYDFTWPLVDWSHPHELVLSKIKQYIDEGIIGNLIARKIDYKKQDCIKLLQQIKYINRYAGNIITGT